MPRTTANTAVDEVLAAAQGLFNPVIDQIVDGLQFVPLAENDPHVHVSETEWRRQQRRQIQQNSYDRRSLDQLARGFELIGEHLPRTSDPQRCHSDLVAAGDRWIQVAEEGKSQADPESQRRIWQNILSVDRQQQAEAPIEPTDEDADQPSFAQQSEVSWDTFLDLFDVGAGLYRGEQVEEAYCVFRVLTFFQSACYELWHALSQCSRALGDLNEAVDHAEAALLADGTNPEGYFHLARAHQQIGDEPQAQFVIQLADEMLADARVETGVLRRWDQLKRSLDRTVNPGVHKETSSHVD